MPNALNNCCGGPNSCHFKFWLGTLAKWLPPGKGGGIKVSEESGEEESDVETDEEEPGYNHD